jgi:CyaY protein
MDESQYQKIADKTLRDVETMLEDVDTDVLDMERAGDVLTLTFAGGKRAVLNTQRPTRQLWLAANARAWHFGWDEASGRWLDDKGQGVELFAQIAAVAAELAGVELRLPS